MRLMEIVWQEKGSGVAEIGGPQANKRIVGYFRSVERPDITSDEVHWCAAAAWYCILKAGGSFAHVPKKDRLLAVSLRQCGRRIEGPRVGAVIVMKRDGGHHTGFIESWTPTTIDVSGGNQSDAFNTRTFKRTADMEYYWADLGDAAEVDEASRIVAASKRQARDAARAAVPQATPPPRVPDVPEGVGEAFATWGPLDVRAPLEGGVSFLQFVSGNWGWVIAAVSIYFLGRMVWDAGWIKHWRKEDAATGKTATGIRQPATAEPNAVAEGNST